MNDCIFCKIIRGEIPCEKVFEDDTTFAFLDRSPVNHGHTLVIHKHHHADIFDTPEHDLADLFRTAKKMSSAVMKGTKCDGINIGMNNRPAAGQTVFHAHVHVIPRITGDGFKLWPQKESTTEQRLKTAATIRQFL